MYGDVLHWLGWTPYFLGRLRPRVDRIDEQSLADRGVLLLPKGVEPCPLGHPPAFGDLEVVVHDMGGLCTAFAQCIGLGRPVVLGLNQ